MESRPESEPRTSSSSSSPRSPPISFGSRPTQRSDTSSSSRLQLLSSPGSLTSFENMMSGGSGSGTLGTASTGLSVLRDILEAFDTLPFVKYIASVGIQLLQYVIESQITNDMYKNLAFRARDVVVAVARSCDGMQSMALQLEQDLQQLIGTMDSILAYATERVSRRTYQKILSKADDAAAVKALNLQLTHAFHIFEIQSSVSTRMLQHQMVQQLSSMSITPLSSRPVTPVPSRPELILNCALRVREGIYIIRNVHDGRVLEAENYKTQWGGTHAYMAPSLNGKSQTQLWLIQKKNNKEFKFKIRNLATGAALDIFGNRDDHGAKVVCHGWNGGGNQTWTFWGTRQGPSEDYCTIRSSGLPTVLDGMCPRSGSSCDALHATKISAAGSSLSQEWQFISLSSISLSSSLATPTLNVVFPRRPLLLQNVRTGSFATFNEMANGANVVLRPSPTPASSWNFLFSTYEYDMRADCFAIATSSANPCTIDHWNREHINISKYWLTNDHHKWAPVPRNGAFIFRNAASGELLAASNSQPDVVDTLPVSARDDPMCHWRLLDAATKEHVRILCDSGLSVLPPELAGSVATLPALPATAAPLTVQTTTASTEVQLAMANSFEDEHDTIRSMLSEGYNALVIAPRLITGWRNGQLKRVIITEDDAEFKYRMDNNFEPCVP